jgi:hypothetical protein
MQDPASFWNPIVFSSMAALIVVTSWMTLTMIPFHAKPKHPTKFTIFCLSFWLITTPVGLVVGLILNDMRIFFDVSIFNLTGYTFFGVLIIPEFKREAIRDYARRISGEWKQEMG